MPPYQMSRLKGPYPCKNFQKMFPKNSRRPLTLDHKIRLKKQLDKAYKSAGIEKSAEVREKRVHQNFKPRPEDKIIKKRQSEEDARDRIREEKDQMFKERQEERNKSAQKRREQNKKLSTKNRRGQPNLNNQIEHLLSKLDK